MSGLEKSEKKVSGIISSPTVIIPNTRIEVLKQFYVSNSGIGTSDLVDESVPGGLSEDARGSWATKKVMEAAVAFNVDHFIECEEKGGEELHIGDIEDYVGAHRKLKSNAMEERCDLIKELKKQKKLVMSRLEVLEEELSRVCRSRPRSSEQDDSNVNATFSRDDDEEEEKEENFTERDSVKDSQSECAAADGVREEEQGGRRTTVRRAPAERNRYELELEQQWRDDKRQLNDKVDRMQSKYEQYIASILTEQSKVDAWEEDYRAKAEKQWSADTDANSKAVSAMLKLKHVVAKLVKKIPEISSVVRMNAKSR